MHTPLLFCSGPPHWASPQFFSSPKYSWPKAWKGASTSWRFAQWREWLYSSANSLKWNFRHVLKSILCVPTAGKLLKERPLLMLYWSQSPFLVWLTPLSQFLIICLLLRTHSVVFSLSMYSCHAEGTSSSRSNYLFLPERNSALISKTTMSVLCHLHRDNKATPLTKQLSPWIAPEDPGDRQWGLRLPSSLRFDTLLSLSVSLAMVLSGRLFILRLLISCISDPRRQLASELGCLLEALAWHMCQNYVWSLASV